MSTIIQVEPPEVWEDQIRILERRAGRNPPRSDAIVFTGSSSIRTWKTLARDMSPLPVVNHGFGGAQVDAVVHYAARLVLPLRPRGVVFGAGENDLEEIRGKTPRRVLDDVARFASLVSGELPRARLYFLNIKPSPARAATWPAAEELNALLAAFCDVDPRRVLLDVATPSFDAHARRRPELFLDDGIHLSAAGYALWTSVVRPRLMADFSGGGAAQ